MASLSQRQQTIQRQHLSPQQLLLLELISKPVDQLEEVVKEQIEANPLIDPPSEQKYNNNDATSNDDRLLSDEYDDNDESNYTNDYILSPVMNDSEGRPSNSWNDNGSNLFDRIADNQHTLADDLLEQLNYKDLNEQQYLVAKEIIGSLNDRGYLSTDLAVIVNDLYSNGIATSIDEVEAMLKVVQSLDPAGIAARSPQECLSLQLHRLQHLSPAQIMARDIVDKHFDLFVEGNNDRLRQQLHTDPESLNKALKEIRQLSLSVAQGESAAYITPDFIVSARNGDLQIMLADANLPEIHLNQDYLDALENLSSRSDLSSSQKQEVSFLQEQKRNADNLITALHQRDATLLAVMKAIATKQHQYLATGNSALKNPLQQKEIAEITGYDPSTISRIVNDKYVQTDFGIIPLSQCFATAYTNDQGESIATDEIHQVLQQLINDEDKHNPLTDDQLTQAINKAGYPVARRTVANYRKVLGILPRHRRRIAPIILLLLLSLAQMAVAQQPMSYYDSIIWAMTHSGSPAARSSVSTTSSAPATVKTNDELQRTRHEVDSILSDDDDIIDSIYNSTLPAPASLWYGHSLPTGRVKPHGFSLDSLPDDITLKLVKSDAEFCFPVPGRINSPYGWRWNRAHRGTDISLRQGDPVRCTFPGVVRIARPMGAYGNLVVVRHENGLETVYGHLSRINVKPFQVVRAGTILGHGGSTGRATGPHLHFEVRFQYEPIDPEWILDFSKHALRTHRLHLDKTYFGIRQPRKGDGQCYKADESIVAEVIPETPKKETEKNKPQTATNNNYYVVQEGDTLNDIADRFGISTRQLQKLNKSLRNTPRPGERLRVK